MHYKYLCDKELPDFVTVGLFVVVGLILLDAVRGFSVFIFCPLVTVFGVIFMSSFCVKY